MKSAQSKSAVGKEKRKGERGEGGGDVRGGRVERKKKWQNHLVVNKSRVSMVRPILDL